MRSERRPAAIVSALRARAVAPPLASAIAGAGSVPLSPARIFPGVSLLWIDGYGGTYLRTSGGAVPTNGQAIATAVSRGTVGSPTTAASGVTFSSTAFGGRGAIAFADAAADKLASPAWIAGGRISGGARWRTNAAQDTLYQHGGVNIHSAVFQEGGPLKMRRTGVDSEIAVTLQIDRTTVFRASSARSEIDDVENGTATETSSRTLPSSALVTYIGGLDVGVYSLNGRIGELVLADCDATDEQMRLLRLYLSRRWVDPIKILPLGDSITRGYLAGGSTAGGYRLGLQTAIDRWGMAWSQIGPYQDDGLFHHGQGGRTISGATAYVAADLGSGHAYRPDVIVLVVGSNDCADVGSPYSGPTAAADLAALLAQIESSEPAVRLVVMSSLPTMTGAYAAYAANVSDFNGRIGAVLDASPQHAAGRMQRVDIGAIVGTSLGDGLHPTQAAYDSMAAAIYPAVVRVCSR